MWKRAIRIVPSKKRCHLMGSVGLLAAMPPWLEFLHCWKVPQVSGDERMVEQWYGSSHLYVFMSFHGCSTYMYIHVWSRIYIYKYSLFEQCFLQVALLKICVNNPYDPFHFDARNACFIQCQLQCCVSGVNTFLYSQNPCLKIISF